MADITLPRPGVPSRWPAGWLITPLLTVFTALLLQSILIALNWSAVMTDTDRSCDTRDSFSSGFNSDFDISRCVCKTPSLDFRDSCNSMYLPLL
jgi:hypothetical protein